MKRILIATMAALSLGGANSTARLAGPQTTEQARQNAAIKNGQSTRQLEEDHFGSIGPSLRRQLWRDSGHTPYEWGISRACAKMRRKNRLRAAGVRGSRI